MLVALELQKSLSKLSLSSSTAPTVTHTKSQKPLSKQKIADSWEDDDGSSSDSEPGLSLQVPKVLPIAPPPTPISPTSQYGVQSQSSTTELFSSHEDTWSNGIASPRSPRSDAEVRRPEKTTAVAGRMIAGALGVRAPKKTDEQRAYDRAVREKEQKRKVQEKEDVKRRQEEAARAKAAAWED